MQAPPCVAVRTAFAWLSTPEDKHPHEQARKIFEGGLQAPGERDQSPYLAREFPDFAALWSDGGFAEWARTLYGPLHDFVLGLGGQS
jgi:exodeoxyribonuclease V gamma subunit